MKVSKAHEKDRFNVMSWKWTSKDTVIISLTDNKTGKSGKFTARVIDGKIIEVLEDGQMR